MSTLNDEALASILAAGKAQLPLAVSQQVQDANQVAKTDPALAQAVKEVSKTKVALKGAASGAKQVNPYQLVKDYNLREDELAKKAMNYEKENMAPFVEAYKQQIADKNAEIDRQNQQIGEQNKVIDLSNVIGSLGRTAEAVLGTSPYRPESENGRIASVSPAQQQRIKELEKVTPDELSLGKMLVGKYVKPDYANPLDAYKFETGRKQAEDSLAMQRERLNMDKQKQVDDKENNAISKTYDAVEKLAGDKNSNVVKSFANNTQALEKYRNWKNNNSYADTVEAQYQRARGLNGAGVLTDQDFRKANLAMKPNEKFEDFISRNFTGQTPAYMKAVLDKLEKVAEARLKSDLRSALDTVKKIYVVRGGRHELDDKAAYGLISQRVPASIENDISALMGAGQAPLQNESYNGVKIELNKAPSGQVKTKKDYSGFREVN